MKIKELINKLNELAQVLPDKDNTEVVLEDSEGNYTYRDIRCLKDDENNTVVLEYNLHEKSSNNIQNLFDSGEMDDVLLLWKKQGVV